MIDNKFCLCFWKKVAGILLAATSFLIVSCSGNMKELSPLTIDDLGISIPDGSSREYSYTDKNGGFYYGMTSTDDWGDWYAGWNINAKRIFADYRLYVDGERLLRKDAHTTVYPDRLMRRYDNAVETFCLLDEPRLLYICVDSVQGNQISLMLEGGNVTDVRKDGSSVVYTAKESPENVVRIAPVKEASIEFADNIMTVPTSSDGFLIAFGTEDDSRNAIDDFRKEGGKRLAERSQRMQSLLKHNSLKTNLDSLDHALAWIMLTNDQLVTHQHGGYGIYAGLPWFTDFWGRDMFISMPGAVLCTGQFETARDILASFARYQDTVSTSPTYGRVPNRLNLEGVLYNTTDGTPRFVMQVHDYLKYTGDTAFVKEIYPSVKIATDASLRLYTDEKGYLTHADADTWMDAKRQSKYPCSPRGNRAVDVQALWYTQLMNAADLARYMNREEDARCWNDAAARLRSNFERDFVDTATQFIYDHLNTDGTGDTQIRPNAIYALDLISDSNLKMHETKEVWERLVYPWGVSSLDQDDEQFHPYHEQWHRYHKDDAYHNGTIWLWNNGMAMQRMIENGQADIAYTLFRNMNRQALAEGAVGSLSENADAWPRAGHAWVRRSGTFLQAWSNSEHIRIWNQYFLGVRPDMLNHSITLAPQLPSDLKEVDSRVNIGDGILHMIISKEDTKGTYRYEWNGAPVTLKLDIDSYQTLDVPVSTGSLITAETDGTRMIVEVSDASGKKTANHVAESDVAKLEKKKLQDAYFSDTHFAEPSYRENIKSMSRYFDPPLTYQSIE
ncbi:MAG: hypothetical protein EGQ20_16520 [Bacteroides oleiciplenus]|nr:hypothetical protein [Bacteroides oleiciplenus]